MSSCRDERPIRTGTFANQLLGELLTFQKESNRKLISIKRTFRAEAKPYMSKEPEYMKAPNTLVALNAWRDRALMVRPAFDELYDATIASIRAKAAEINPEALAPLATNIEPGTITHSGVPVDSPTQEQVRQWLEDFKQGLVKLADAGAEWKKEMERWEALVLIQYTHHKRWLEKNLGI